MLMIHLLLPCLPLAGGVTTPAAAETVDTPQAPSVLRTYDFSALAALGGNEDVEEAMVPLLPFTRFLPNNENASWDSIDRDLDPVHRLIDLAAQVLEDDGWMVETDDRGRAQILAPEDDHDRINALRRFVEASAFSSPTVSVTVLPGQSGGAESRIVSAAEAATILGGAGDDGPTFRQTRSLRSGEASHFTDFRTRTVNVDPVVEIAQTSAVQYAEIYEMVSGLEAQLRGSWNQGSLDLNYHIRNTRSEEVDGAEVESIQRFVLAEGGVRTVESSWTPPAATVGAALSGGVRLREGEALYLAATRSGAEHAILIEFDLPAPTGNRSTVHVLGGGRVLRAVPRSLFREWSVEARSCLTEGSRDIGLTADQLRERGSDALLGVQYAWPESLMTRALDMLDVAAVLTIGESSYVIATEAQDAMLADLVEMAAATVPARLNVQATFDHARGGDSRVSVGAVVESGKHAVMAVGSERLEARAFDCEVAQMASTLDARVESHFEGLAMSLSCHPLADGRLAYSLLGQYSKRLEQFEHDGSSSGGQGLAGVVADHSHFRNEGIAASGGDGTWTIVIGDEGSAVGSVVVRAQP